MSKKTIGITIIGDSIIRHKKNNVIYDWSAELKKEILKRATKFQLEDKEKKNKKK